MGYTGTWLRWIAVPWHEWSLAAALVAAAAAPVMLVASADVWRAASEDDVAARAVDDASLVRNGVDVLVESALAADTVAAADAAIGGELDLIPQIDDEDRTVYTLPGLLTIGPPPLRQVGTGRVFAREGALDEIAIVEQLPDTTGGVWVTTWFAERHGLSPGDGLAFEAGAIVDEQWNDLVQGGGANSVFRIVGVYEPLWSPDPENELSPYWQGVAPELVPVYIRAFNGPNSELVLADESTLLTSGITGVVRWRAPLSSIPETFDEVRQLRDRVRRFEGELVGTGELSDAMRDLATSAGRRPQLRTDLFDTVASVESAAQKLSGPIASAQGVGGIIGLVAMFAVGVFFVERRRTEFRLLASEGERWAAMSARLAGQLVLPVAVGSAVGVGAALAGPRWFGPARRFETSALPWDLILGTTAAALGLAALTGGLLGARSLASTDRHVAQSVARVLVAVLVLATIGAWVQVGRTASVDAESLDLVVVALPVLAVLLAVVVLLAVMGWLVRLPGRHIERLPVEGFLAMRRLTCGSVGVRMVAGALGLGIGLLVFAVALTSTLDQTVEVKLATEVGGETSAAIIDDLPAEFRAPAPTTVIRTFDTLLTPGRTRARVIAIDPDTYVEAVAWPDQFGAELDSVIAALAGPFDDSVPMIGIDGERGGSTGAFGLGQTYPYRVVDRIGAFPGAGENQVSLLALADSIDGHALAEAGLASPAEAAEINFRLPVERFRRKVISQANPDELTAALDAAGVRYRDVVSRRDRRRDAGIVATRSAFGYLGVIGVVASAAALVAMALYLAARRRVRALSGVMTRTMGLAPGRSALVTVLELAAVIVVATSAGFIAAPLVVRRLSGRFDPAPQRPPDVLVLVSWLPLLGAAVAAVVVISSGVWLSERWAARRRAGEVVRDAG